MANDCLYSSKTKQTFLWGGFAYDWCAPPPTHTHTPHTPFPIPKHTQTRTEMRKPFHIMAPSGLLHWQQCSLKLTCYLHSNRDEHKVWSPEKKKTSSHKRTISPQLFKALIFLGKYCMICTCLLISGGIWDFARSNVHPFNEGTTHSWASLTPWVTTIFIHLSVRMLEPTVFSIMFHKQQ